MTVSFPDLLITTVSWSLILIIVPIEASNAPAAGCLIYAFSQCALYLFILSLRSIFPISILCGQTKGMFDPGRAMFGLFLAFLSPASQLSIEYVFLFLLFFFAQARVLL